MAHMRIFKIILISIFLLGLTGIVAGAALVSMMWHEFSEDLPDHSKLKTYEPPITSRVYAWNGQLMGEFAKEKRIFVPIENIPPQVKNAFLSAEDRNFYEHPGIDVVGVVRAILINLENAGGGRRLVGASTITQQVAKNFLLTNEVSFERKIKEAILAFRLEQSFSKDHLLELYLNQIYLGGGAYGVAAAAQHYYGKTLDELNVSELAYLAALPKAPNNYNPIKHEKAAIARRDWVLARMAEDGHITRREMLDAQKMPLGTVQSDEMEHIEAPYFLEEVRREIADKFGSDSLYKGGLVVRSTLNPELQEMAAKSLHDGLVNYDRTRTGYRGAVTNIPTTGWEEALALVERPAGMPPQWQLAVVLSGKKLGLVDGTEAVLSEKDAGWGGAALKKGAVVMVETADKETRLRQIPKVQGAIIVMDPHTGRVLAMEGGWDYAMSQFNRATQALRQTGSAFKPFIYAAALEKGASPSTLVSDGPIEFYAGPGQGMWRPKNYSEDYLGNIPVSVALEKSRNLVTIRLAQFVGMKTVSEFASKFGVKDGLEPHLANSLGSAETTLQRLTAGYAIFANGGKKVTPSLIDRVQNRKGETVYRHEERNCAQCDDRTPWRPSVMVPDIENNAQTIISPAVAYQMTQLLEGVVQRGTAMSLRELNTPLAGKTGTTNESRDTWFIGFSPDLVAGVFIGYDEPKSLGAKATGGNVALPVFKEFMQSALKDQPPVPFRIPPDVRLILINSKSGLRTTTADPNALWMPFSGDTDPESTGNLLTRGVVSTDTPSAPTSTMPSSDPNAPAPSPATPLFRDEGDVSTPPAETPPPQPVIAPTMGGTGGLY